MEFLISIERIDDTERYILERAEQLHGRHYDYLLSAARGMESYDRYLVTSLLYRALLEAILEKGNTKAYSHGARYLKKLDALAESVGDWRGYGCMRCSERGWANSIG